jgi:hypothetical protein
MPNAYLSWTFNPADDHYEIRDGATWSTATVLGSTKDNQFYALNPTPGSHTFQVAAVSAAGVYGPPSSIVIVIPPDPTTQTTLAGTTAGAAVSSQPANLANYKKFIVFLNGYENTTGTPQTIAYPVAFTQTPVFTDNSDPPCTATSTTLTLPASMSAPTTGFAVLEGY